MARDQGRSKIESSKSTIAKELFVGLLAVGLGVYNLLSELGYVTWNIEIPRIIGSITLIVVGVMLWLTAFKLWKYRWHTRRMF